MQDKDQGMKTNGRKCRDYFLTDFLFNKEEKVQVRPD